MSKLVLLYAVKNFVPKFNGSQDDVVLEIKSEDDFKIIGWNYDTLVEVRDYIANTIKVNGNGINVYLSERRNVELRATTYTPTPSKPATYFYNNENYRKDIATSGARFRTPSSFSSSKELSELFDLVESGFTVFYKIEEVNVVV